MLSDFASGLMKNQILLRELPVEKSDLFDI